MGLKDYSFVVVYVAALLCILMIFTAIFFDGVIASNTTTIIKRYVTNAATIDSSVRETVAGAASACKGQSPTGIHFLGGSVSTATYGMIGVLAIAFLMHIRFRLKDNYSIFNLREQVCLWMLTLPVVVEVIVYFFSYVNFKYYSNIYIVKLLKNMRIRADLKYLSELWSRDQSKIESSGSKTVDGTCTNNCLPAEERVALMVKIRSYLTDYNKMLDVDEWNNTTPSSFWSKISNLPSKTGLAFLVIFTLIQCGFLWKMRTDNIEFVVAVVGVTSVFVVYLFLVKDYLTIADMDSVSTYKTVFCQTGQDAVSALLKRDMTDQSNFDNDDV